MSLSDKLGCYVQGHGDSQKMDLPGDSSQLNQYFVEAGIVYYPKNNMQFDISSGSSVGTANTYSFLTLGFCLRLPN